MELHSHTTSSRDVALTKVSPVTPARSLRSLASTALCSVVRPAETFCVRASIRPDRITVASLVLAVLSAVACAEGALGFGGALYLAAGALDLLDGRVARLSGTASARGAALDSIVDRVAESLVLGGLAWALRGTVGVFLCFALLSASMVVSYARARGEGLGVFVDAGMMVRAPRVALLALAMSAEGLFGSTARSAPSLFFLLALAVLTVLTIWTAITRVLAVLRTLPGSRSTSAPAPRPPHVHPAA